MAGKVCSFVSFLPLTGVIDDVLDGMLAQRVVQRDAVDGHAVAGLHGDHPLGGVGAVHTGAATRRDAHLGHRAGNSRGALLCLLVREPLVPAGGAALAQAVVVWIALDGLGEELVKRGDALESGRPILGNYGSARGEMEGLSN